MFPSTHTYPNLYCEDCGEPLYEPFYSTENGDFVCETCAENHDEADLTPTTYDDVDYEMASHIRNLDDVRDDI